MSQQLTGEIAIVTGASKGIGAAIGQHLAAEGAAVVVNDGSSEDGSDGVVAEITVPVAGGPGDARPPLSQ